MSDDNTLVLTHVIFRHGNRTPDLSYPNDPYKDVEFFPTGKGLLTMKGKAKAYELGRILRKKYNNFLGEVFLLEDIDAWSTDSDRTKMSLQLVLASLFPPNEEQRFETSLNWQPIPYKYIYVRDDDMLLSFVHRDTIDAYNEYAQSEDYAKSTEKYTDIFRYISTHSGLNIKTIKDAMILYSHLKIQEDLGLSLPDWAVKTWKEFEHLVLLGFQTIIATAKLQKLLLGKLLKKIIDDADRKLERKSKCKMHLYSGHDVNVGTLLSFFGILSSYPPYCSYVSFELHRIDGEYSIKIVYHDCETSEPKYVGEFIKYDGFKRICEDVYAEK